MPAVAFDTLKFVQSLEQAGIERVQASAFAGAVRDAWASTDVTTKVDLNELRHSTKADIDELRIEIGLLRKDMESMDASLRKELAAMEMNLRKDMAAMEMGLRKEMAAMDANLRKEMEVMRKDIIIKVGAMLMSAVGLIVGLTLTGIRFLL